jgi:GTPase Era involved in 16S rRNA processing
MLPQVVIVGRPNVGKSSLFNWLIEKRIAIEDPTAGVTRDRLVQRIELDGRVLELVDTGGMGFDDPDGLTAEIDRQIESGLAHAAVVLFVVDVRTGIAPGDLEVAQRIDLRSCASAGVLTSVGSAATRSAFRPSASTSAAVSSSEPGSGVVSDRATVEECSRASPGATVRAETATSYPARARCWAQALPMPRSRPSLLPLLVN